MVCPKKLLRLPSFSNTTSVINLLSFDKIYKDMHSLILSNDKIICSNIQFNSNETLEE